MSACKYEYERKVKIGRKGREGCVWESAAYASEA